MNFMRTSARDDIISVFYLVLLSLDIKFLELYKRDESSDKSLESQFNHVRNIKKNTGLKCMALYLRESDNKELFVDDQWKRISAHLAELGELIENISFADKPPYSKIRQYLKSCK